MPTATTVVLSKPKSVWKGRAAYLKTDRYRAVKAVSMKSRQKERRAIIGRIKTERGCLDCGYNANPYALQFDHVRGVKAGTVSQMTCFSWTRIMAEIAKCEVRCANCHAIKTHDDEGA